MKEGLSLNEMPLNGIKPFVIANVKLQCKLRTTARMCIIGSPGCGKSDLLRQICEENGWGLVVKYMSNMSLEQITGIPCKVEDGDHARFTKPEIFNFDELDYTPEGYDSEKTTTVLLIDDFHLADKVIQKYLFQLLTYKAINSYRLPDNCAIILAGNKLSDKALAHTIPAPVMNRISMYEVKADPKDWVDNFAFKHGVRADIISFISSRGDKYLLQDPIESSPWASPRAWTFLSEQMDQYEELYGEIPTSKLKFIANSLVGNEFGSAFIMYKELFSKWSVEKLKGKTEDELKLLFEKEISKNPIAAYAIINAAMSWLIEESKKKSFDIKDRDVLFAVKFTYELMTIMLKTKCKGVQIKPLVIAGTTYLYAYFKAIPSAEATKFNKVIELFMEQMEKQRPIDWIYYEIICTVFDFKLTDDDKKAIEAAKASLEID